MTIKRILAVPAALALILAMVLAMALAGCGGGSADDPAEAAKLAFETTLAMDIDALLDVSCEKMQAEIEASREELEMMKEMMKGLGIDLSEIEYDISGLSWDVIEQSEETAKVHMHGTMAMSAPGLGEESQEQDEEVLMVKEGGAWKLCSEME